jgi:5'-deoxynucleotidase YfbR-like HD superfamily hydrolase
MNKLQKLERELKKANQKLLDAVEDLKSPANYALSQYKKDSKHKRVQIAKRKHQNKVKEVEKSIQEYKNAFSNIESYYKDKDKKDGLAKVNEKYKEHFSE